MDIALVLDSRPSLRSAPTMLRRPFGDSSLLELAMDKLAALDAPVRKIVLVNDSETRNLARLRPGLTAMRIREDVVDLTRPQRSFAELRDLAESWFLWINPAYPLLDAERWWQAVDRFLGDGSRGLLSVRDVEGPLIDDQGHFLPPQTRVQALTDALVVCSRDAIADEGALFPAEPELFLLGRDESRRVDDATELAAVESIWAMSRLGMLV